MTGSTSVAPVGRLVGPIRPYAWGSRTVIATLQGRTSPAPGPEAELWLGAHPSDPAHLDDATGPALDTVIAADPDATLGSPVVARFGSRLPYLLKVLAIEAPLSLQVHPSEEQAADGFRIEDARGIPRDAPERTFRDPWPKPELLCALTGVDALCGFRDVAASVAFLDHLGVPELAWMRDALAHRGHPEVPVVVRRLLTLPEPERAPLVAGLVTAAEGVVAAGGAHAADAGWTVELGRRYPSDPGVAVALLMQLVRLRPGEAVHLGAGVPHAYLRGSGVEIMASSDNVLRGGLTAKHVDVDGLLDVLDVRAGVDHRVRPEERAGGHAYPAPVEHFALERLALDGSRPLDLGRRGPDIVLCVGGDVEVAGDGHVVCLRSGEAAFVPASTHVVRLAGAGVVFRATVGDPVNGGRQPDARSPRRG